MLTKDMFVAHNNVHLCGKIVRKVEKKREVIFVLSCGHGVNQKKDKNGLIQRDVISVHFFDDQATMYNNRFEEGDFVTVTAVMQTVRNHYTGTYTVETWGLSMGPKYVNGKIIRDCNNVQIRGKIESVNVINDNYIIINVLTKVDKNFKNPNKESEKVKLTKSFKSVTPIGIRCNGDAKDVAWNNYTEGTWVDVRAFVYGKKISKDNKMQHVERVIAKTVSVVGNVQPHKITM